MIVASTIVPCDTSNPLAFSSPFIFSNRRAGKSCCSSRWRKLWSRRVGLPSHQENPRTDAGSRCRRAHPPSDGPTRRTIAEESRSAASMPNRPADDPALRPADSAVPPPPKAPATEPLPPSPPKTTRDASGASCSRTPDQKNSLVATFVPPTCPTPTISQNRQKWRMNQRFLREEAQVRILQNNSGITTCARQTAPASESCGIIPLSAAKGSTLPRNDREYGRQAFRHLRFPSESVLAPFPSPRARPPGTRPPLPVKALPGLEGAGHVATVRHIDRRPPNARLSSHRSSPANRNRGPRRWPRRTRLR